MKMRRSAAASCAITGLPQETYRDPGRRISRSFGAYMSTATYIIQDGRIIRKVVGAIDWMSTEIRTFLRLRTAAVKKYGCYF
jgi:hypothetical protein